METECTAEKASPLCGFVALLLTLGTTSLMNGSLFPQFDAIFMFARDISVTFSAATLLGLGLAAYRAPRLLWERAHRRRGSGLSCRRRRASGPGAWVFRAGAPRCGCEPRRHRPIGGDHIGGALSRAPRNARDGRDHRCGLHRSAGGEPRVIASAPVGRNRSLPGFPLGGHRAYRPGGAPLLRHGPRPAFAERHRRHAAGLVPRAVLSPVRVLVFVPGGLRVRPAFRRGGGARHACRFSRPSRLPSWPFT